MRGAFAYLVTLLQLAPAQPHAVMKTPTPRPASGMQNTGTKLQPFNAAQSYADGGCGGSTNGDPGVQQPTIAFQSGAQVTVTWELTIPHPADNLDSGIRIAVHYGPGDSFAQNILAGGVINSGQPNTVSADLLTTTVQLPAGKVSDYATIQWVWSANQDGGSYIGCADVAITANGALPTNYVPNARQGEVLSGVAATATGPGSIVQPSPPPPPPQGGNVGSGNNQGAPSGDGGNPAVPVAVFLILGAVGFYGYTQYKKMKSNAGSGPTVSKTDAPPPPPVPSADPGLPPGWSSAVDPASGVTYYIDPQGGSQWTAPERV